MIYSNTIKALALILVSSVVSAVRAQQQETAEEYEERIGSLLRRAFDEQINPYEASAWWFGVTHPVHGDRHWAFGNSTDTDGSSPPDTPATPDDRFFIGSVSKSFGAVVNLLLVSEGAFSLDDAVSALVPDFAADFPQYANFTTRDLMGMRTDVPDFLNDPDGMLATVMADPAVRYSIPEIVAFAMQKYPQEDAPQYSTTNVLVMELIAEAVTGESMPALVERYVTSEIALDLSETVLPPRDSDGLIPPPAAASYVGKGCKGEFAGAGAAVEEGDPVSAEFAGTVVNYGTGGGIYSTIADLTRWAASGSGDSLLPPDLVAERHVFRPHYYPGIPDLIAQQYGLGIEMYKDGPLGITMNPDWVGHSGDTFSSNTEAYRNDALNLSFASAISTCGYMALHTSGRDIVEADLRGDGGVGEGPTASPTKGAEPPTADGTPSSSPPPTILPAPSSGSGALSGAMAAAAAAVVGVILGQHAVQ